MIFISTILLQSGIAITLAETQSINAAEASVEVANQPIVDERVIIQMVESIGDGWIVIHNQTVGGTFGAILGYSHVDNGTNENVTVKLDLEKKTSTLYAMLHTDSGVLDTFEFPGVDGPVKDSADNIIAPTFDITGEFNSSVMVSNQAVVDDKVMIENVISSGLGWIVVHNKSNAGSPGAILGYAELVHGTNSYVVVEINEPQRTETLFAMLHADNGTHEIFEFPSGPDGPVKDSTGQIITPPFNITNTLSSSVTVEDQSILNDKVVVSEVISAGKGWIVIHADNGGSPGSILGHSPLEHGLNTNIEITISTSGRTPTMYAMLHTDEDEFGQFEFPGGSDVPVKDELGNVITPSFNVTNLNESTSTSSSTPGFNLAVLASALAVVAVFSLKRKRKKLN